MVNFRGLTSVQGGTIPAQLWHNYMAAALASEPQYAGTFPLVYSFGGQTLTPPPVGSASLFPAGPRDHDHHRAADDHHHPDAHLGAAGPPPRRHGDHHPRPDDCPATDWPTLARTDRARDHAHRHHAAGGTPTTRRG